MSDVNQVVDGTAKGDVDLQEKTDLENLAVPTPKVDQSESACIEDSETPNVEPGENSLTIKTTSGELALSAPLITHNPDQPILPESIQAQNKVVHTISDELAELDPLERSTEFMIDSADGSADMNNLPPVPSVDSGTSAIVGGGRQPVLSDQHE